MSTSPSLPPRPSLLTAFTPPPDPSPETFNRLSLPFPTRLTLSTLVSSTAGFFLGAAKGMKDCELRFRAENAHRLPTSTTGWYLYHKSKNYHALLGGIKEGARMGVRVAGWGVVFLGVEEGVDRGRARVVRTWRRTLGAPRREVEEGEEEDGLRIEKVAGNRDFLSTGFAGLTTGGVFAAWKRMPLPTATRLMKMGMKYGLLFGLAEDAINVLKGRRLGYVEFGKRLVFGRAGKGDVEEVKERAAVAG